MKEADLHRAIVRYLRLVLPHGFMIQHSPNGGMMKGEVAKAKGLGAVAGWPDIAIYGPVEREFYTGGIDDRIVIETPTAFFLEVKTKTGQVRPNQHEVHDRLKDIGFAVAVVRSIDDVRECIREWGLPSREVAA